LGVDKEKLRVNVRREGNQRGWPSKCPSRRKKEMTRESGLHVPSSEGKRERRTNKGTVRGIDEEKKWGKDQSLWGGNGEGEKS